MNNMKQLKEIFDGATTMALATSIDDAPQVRIVNFAWDENTPAILYFTSDRTNNKVKQMAQNPKVSFTTIPSVTGNTTHVRSVSAIAHKSNKILAEVAPLFIAKEPDYAQTVTLIGDTLDVFEVCMEKLALVLGFDEVAEINFMT